MIESGEKLFNLLNDKGLKNKSERELIEKSEDYWNELMGKSSYSREELKSLVPRNERNWGKRNRKIILRAFEKVANRFISDELKKGSFRFSKYTLQDEGAPDSYKYLSPYGYVHALAIASETKMAQIRKLFYEVKKLKTVRNKYLQASRISFMSKYALARGTIRPLLDEFIQNSIKIIEGNRYKDGEIEGFIEFFKALIAYSKAK